MIKFIHKKYLTKDSGEKNIVIYYNLSDIFLGLSLLALVVFFSVNYFITAKEKTESDCFFIAESGL